MKSNITFAIGGGGDPPKEPVSKSDVPYSPRFDHLHIGTYRPNESFTSYGTWTKAFDEIIPAPEPPKIPKVCVKCGEELINVDFETFKSERHYDAKKGLGTQKIKYKNRKWVCPNRKRVVFNIYNGHTEYVVEPVRVGPKYDILTGEENW